MESFSLIRYSDTSILNELRTKKHRQRDFLETFPTRLPSSKATPAEITKHHKTGSRFFLYIDEKGAFVHEDIFSDLNAISVAQMQKGKRHIIGTLKMNIPWKTLVQFLIEADIIGTYIHMESSMTIQLSSSTHAHVKGTHTYFTNEENTEEFSFLIELDHHQQLSCTCV